MILRTCRSSLRCFRTRARGSGGVKRELKNEVITELRHELTIKDAVIAVNDAVMAGLHRELKLKDAVIAVNDRVNNAVIAGLHRELKLKDAVITVKDEVIVHIVSTWLEVGVVGQFLQTRGPALPSSERGARKRDCMPRPPE
jgi:hypothetical protein